MKPHILDIVRSFRGAVPKGAALRRSTMFGAALAVFVACSGSEKPKPEPPPKELAKSSARTVDTPEEELLRAAKKHYAAALYTAAREKFEALRDSYPSGAYAEFARLKIADTYFDTGEFQTAAANYEDFATSYPTSPSLPYALLRSGRSYHLSSRGAGRDVSPIQRAVEQYDKLIAQFPESPYAAAARDLKTAAATTLAEHGRFVKDFYENQELEKAAAHRGKEVDEQWKRLEEERRRVEKLKATRKERGVKGELPTPVVHAATRSGPRTRRALLPTPARPGREATSRPEEAKLVDGVETETNASTPTDGDMALSLRSVECAKGATKKIFLHLSRPVDDLAFSSKIKVSRRPGTAGKELLLFELPGVRTRSQVVDCFAPEDLVVSSGGVITLHGASVAKVMSLESPPRLLVTVK